MFQHCFNVAFWLIWRRSLGRCKINVERVLCVSTLGFAMSKNIESTLCISTLIWTILDNIKKTLSFATLSFKTLVNVETTFQCENDVKMTISRKGEKIISNWIQWFLNFNHFFIIFFTLIIPLLRGTY